MKKMLVLGLMVILVLSLFGCSSVEDEELAEDDNQEQLAQYQAGELVVGIKEQAGVSTQNVDGLISAQVKEDQERIEADGFKVVDSVYDFNDGRVSSLSNEMKAQMVETMGFVYTVEFDQNKFESYSKAKSALKEALEESGTELKYIEPNFQYHALGAKNFPKIPEEEISSLGVSTTEMNRQQSWHYEMIKAPKTWDKITKGDSSVKVAILDTGADEDHPSIRGLINRDLAKSFVSYTFDDGNGHGTHVAGTIASQGRVSGVMQEAELIPVKVLGDQGGGSLTAIQKGIVYAANAGVDVINMSLGGGGYSQAMADACQTAVKQGTVVVAASGNESNSSISYPSRYESVISVGAVD